MATMKNMTDIEFRFIFDVRHKCFLGISEVERMDKDSKNYGWMNLYPFIIKSPSYEKVISCFSDFYYIPDNRGYKELIFSFYSALNLYIENAENFRKGNNPLQHFENIFNKDVDFIIGDTITCKEDFDDMIQKDIEYEILDIKTNKDGTYFLIGGYLGDEWYPKEHFYKFGDR